MNACVQLLQALIQFCDPAGATHGNELIRQQLCRGGLVPRGRRLSQDQPDLRVIGLGGQNQSVLNNCMLQYVQFVPGPLQPTVYRHIRGVSVPQPELPLGKGQRMCELEVRRSSVPRSPSLVMQSCLGEFKRSVFTRPRGVFMAMAKHRKPGSSRPSSLPLVPTS